MIPKRAGSGSQQSLPTLLVLVAAGLLVSAFYAIAAPGAFLSILSTNLMTAGACLVVGGLLGFLFGIPKVLTSQQERVSIATPGEASSRSRAGSASEENHPETPYEPNTNLEQVSDWLTKILVGVGLTQISTIQRRLADVADYLSPALGNTPSSKPFVIFLILYFLICGFFVSYLWTRLYFGSALQAADRKQLKSLTQRVAELDEKTQHDSEALLLVNRLLNAETDQTSVDSRKLAEAVKNSSPAMRAHIFYLATAVRSSNWGPGGDREKLERTIPIYKALIEADPDEKYHRNHGQLGYALKDMPDPDWQGAFNELGKAIEIRDKRQESGYVFYEGNRAICRIHLDDSADSGKPASPQVREAIVRDIQVGRLSDWKGKTFLTDPVVMKWMVVNAPDDLQNWLSEDVPDQVLRWIEDSAPSDVRTWVMANAPDNLRERLKYYAPYDPSVDARS